MIVVLPLSCFAYIEFMFYGIYPDKTGRPKFSSFNPSSNRQKIYLPATPFALHISKTSKSEEGESKDIELKYNGAIFKTRTFCTTSPSGLMSASGLDAVDPQGRRYNFDLTCKVH